MHTQAASLPAYLLFSFPPQEGQTLPSSWPPKKSEKPEFQGSRITRWKDFKSYIHWRSSDLFRLVVSCLEDQIRPYRIGNSSLNLSAILSNPLTLHQYSFQTVIVHLLLFSWLAFSAGHNVGLDFLIGVVAAQPAILPSHIRPWPGATGLPRGSSLMAAHLIPARIS